MPQGHQPPARPDARLTPGRVNAIFSFQRTSGRGLLEVIRKRHRLATVEHVRAAVYRAREMGYLGGRRQGVVRGFLTDKAKEVLVCSATRKRAKTTRQRAAKK